MSITQNIADYYNANVIEEDNRLQSNSMEYLMTAHLISSYAYACKNVCDLGGGTGIYALPLAQECKNVTLVDISSNEIKCAENKANNKGVSINTICGDLFAEDFHITGSYDLVLCLGPLYHCRDMRDICEVLNKVEALLHQDSIAIIAFLSKYSKFNDLAKLYGLNSAYLPTSGRNADPKQIPSKSLGDVCSFYEKVLETEDLFLFVDKGIPISFVEPTLIRPFLQNRGFLVREVVASDICDHVDKSSSPEELYRFIELSRILGRMSKINDGNHILSVIQRVF